MVALRLVLRPVLRLALSIAVEYLFAGANRKTPRPGDSGLLAVDGKGGVSCTFQDIWTELRTLRTSREVGTFK
jgi:hypothetical protein